MSEYVLRLKTVQAGVFRTLIEVLKECLNDVNVTFDAKGMTITAIDGAKVALIDLKLYADRFEAYECVAEGDVVLGMNMGCFHKIMKTVSNTDTIELFVLAKNRNELCIVIDNPDRSLKSHFALKLLDIDDEVLTVPSVVVESIVTMPSADLQRLCRDMSNLGSEVDITSVGDQLTFTVEGDFAKQTTVLGEGARGISVSNNTADSKTGRFPLKYITLFTKSTNLCAVVDIIIRNGYPLILKYNVSSLGEIRYCLAPIVTC